jgi:hypothetical protein
MVGLFTPFCTSDRYFKTSPCWLFLFVTVEGAECGFEFVIATEGKQLQNLLVKMRLLHSTSLHSQ